uniref:Large ribosomal subunit protein uL16m n=1 Tax=Coleochaete scutata TaxID=3125 RepID=A0A5P9NVZ9_COLSC|nr:ribosomal protein L16 [Coleochaete scutata]QFU80146.1 ribosomal protein L16 [Coleochaete scutata]QIQ23004.1 ribosomal protein L16 [Coleochaete scutata]
MLYPRRTKFRKYQKGRVPNLTSSAQVFPSFGKYGIQSAESCRLPYQTIEATRRVITRKLRRIAKVWVRVFADIPVTSKPAEVRMGKGKGNPTGWIARISKGQILFEMDGVSLPHAQQAARLASHKLGLKTKFIVWS